jgi:hypothetical protein
MNLHTLTTRLVLAAALFAAAAGFTANDSYAAPAEEYVPFVTDFPKPVSEPAAPEAAWIDWAAGLDVGLAALLVAMLAGALLIARRAQLGGAPSRAEGC